MKFAVLPEVTKDITVEVRPLAHAPLAIFALFKGPPLYLAPFENFHKLHPSLLRRRETLRKSGEGGGPSDYVVQKWETSLVIVSQTEN